MKKVSSFALKGQRIFSFERERLQKNNLCYALATPDLVGDLSPKGRVGVSRR
ncbi:MAG: hypothetical protein LBB88_11375 [Planctomycetaceae bacterium]|nr:hypothetical protein [Planctomycetaceae bacterium]